MSAAVAVYTSNTLVYTGKGVLTGLVATCNTGTVLVTIYDNTSAAIPKLFEFYVTAGHPLVLFFEDYRAPRFSTGCYIAFGAVGVSVVLWTRQL